MSASPIERSMYARRGSCPAGILRPHATSSESEDDDDDSSSQATQFLEKVNSNLKERNTDIFHSKQMGFFGGIVFAVIVNLLVGIFSLSNNSKCFSNAVDAILVPLLMTSFFCLLCPRSKLLSTKNCVMYLCAVCAAETVSQNHMKAPLVMSVSITTVYMTSMFSDRTNVIISAALCIIRNYALRELRMISMILRPYAVYISAFCGMIACQHVRSFIDDDCDQRLPAKRRIRITFMNNGHKKRHHTLYSLGARPAKSDMQIHRINTRYSSFSLSATPSGTVIDIPNVKSKRILAMKLRNATSFDNLASNRIGNYVTGQRYVHFKRADRTSDYDTDTTAAAVTSNENPVVTCTEESCDHVMPFSEEELDKLLPLESVLSWHFDIFEFAKLTQDNLMSMLAYRIFDQVGLMDAFNIPLEQFFNFTRLVQSTYHDNPYHNRIHACDVLHTCFVLTTADIKFSSGDNGKTDSDSELFQFKEDRRCIGARLTPLEVLAIYVAAMIHDVDHPGRTNSFLIKKRHRLAILYNDRSVLENHHVAEAWRCILSNPCFDFLCNLETEEWERLRFLVVELVLATDLVKHQFIMDEFVKQSSSIISLPKVNWNDAEHRLLVCKMIIKIADVATPCKPLPLYLMWARRVQDEFYLQGDEEKSSNLPVSEFMDRDHPDEIRLQNNFTKNITLPIIERFDEAGLLPYERGNKDKCELVRLLHSNQEFLYRRRQRGENVLSTNISPDDVF